MTRKSDRKDLVVIGGGAGGLALANRAARLGLKVGIIDKYPKLGGDCLHLGCVPSKALLAVAQLYQDVNQAEHFRLPNQANITIDWAAIKTHLIQVREQIQPRYSQQHSEALGCEVMIGSPKFISPNKLAILDKIWTAKKIVIATGSRAMVLPIPGLAPEEIHTNETIYNLDKLPKSMVIVGAGVTGIEFAQAFQRLGVKVTVLVHSERILRTLDIQGSNVLSAVLKKEGIDIFTYAKITQATKTNDKISLVIQNQTETLTLDTEVVFVATGRLPNIENLDLEQAGIQYSKQGIEVDAYFRTNIPHIYAIGDVVAWPHRYAHMAEYGADIVYRHLYLKNFAPKAKLNLVPGVIFTSPEMGSLGLTEQEAQAQKLRYDTLYWEFNQLDRAAINSKPEGFIKLLLVKQKVIGATVVCDRAGELLAELGLLIQKNLPIHAILETIHAYPTWSEGLRKAVQGYLDKQDKPPTLGEKLKRFIKRRLI
jgi:pyruvate/2-oxoglutarate dehydrogenase complex dihydrolipoamide dehydrogenase (E3) component